MVAGCAAVAAGQFLLELVVHLYLWVSQAMPLFVGGDLEDSLQEEGEGVEVGEEGEVLHQVMACQANLVEFCVGPSENETWAGLG